MSGTPTHRLLCVLLGTTLALLFASAAFAALEVHPAVVTLSRNDQVKLSYIGKRDVSTLLEKPPPGFTVLVEENEDRTPVTGTVNLFPDNATEGTYDYLLALHSSAPYTVTLSVLRYNETAPPITEYGIQAYKIGYRSVELITELDCPANITTQINLSLHVTKPQPGTSPPLIAIATLPSVPVWIAWVFAASLSVFFTTSLLSIRDLERAGKRAWTFRQSAMATLIRHVLFGLIVAFLVVAITLLGAFLWGLLTGLAVVPSVVLVWMLIVSALPAVLAGVVYRLAKWRGWYDQLDEGG